MTSGPLLFYQLCLTTSLTPSIRQAFSNLKVLLIRVGRTTYVLSSKIGKWSDEGATWFSNLTCEKNCIQASLAKALSNFYATARGVSKLLNQVYRYPSIWISIRSASWMACLKPRISQFGLVARPFFLSWACKISLKSPKVHNGRLIFLAR